MRYEILCKGVARDRHEEADTMDEAIEIGERWMCINENEHSYAITDTVTGEPFPDKP